jgi:hypothetical protein
MASKQERFNTPILLTIFNRPDVTKLIFEQIKKIKPKQLFISADGPRNDEEKTKCDQAKEIVSQINWDCEVYKNFATNNMGCKQRMTSGITWFFNQVDRGIILEDDCLPNRSFFFFCQNLLEKYKNNDQIFMINGANYVLNGSDIQETYFFSKFFSIWGWATWRRAWTSYDINMNGVTEFLKTQKLKSTYDNNNAIKYYEYSLRSTYQGKIDTWDAQWLYTCLKNDALSITPKYNLISNIGFKGAHIKKQSDNQNLPTRAIDYEHIIHPQITENKKLMNEQLKSFGITKFRPKLRLANWLKK